MHSSLCLIGEFEMDFLAQALYIAQAIFLLKEDVTGFGLSFRRGRKFERKVRG
jgi:hypothetical protein